ncbi:MAG: adenine-specific methyltransferase EcoRI family protein, partial [Acinetobacter sp.]
MRTANSEQRTANSEQRTANSEQRTANSNKTLSKAKRAKQDEFYTQLNDIANELRHYRSQLEGKVIYCNCDDPFESKFFQYFALNFNALKIKKLITTSYIKSPIAGNELPLFADLNGKNKNQEKQPIVVEINQVLDLNNDG